MRLYSLLILLVSATFLQAAERPNIVFIFSDDHALNAISAYGGPLKDVAPTPNIDRIAKDGTVFTRSYCGNSICGPSRATVLTGKHSVLNGFIDNTGSRFDGAQQTFPKLLQKAGYQTSIIGKWHLESTPTGFDHWDILNGQGTYYNPQFITEAGMKMETGYATDLITDKGLAWLKEGRDKSKPFVLMLQHKAPHRSWSPAERHFHLFDNVTIPEPPSLFDDYANRDVSLSKQEMQISKNFSWGPDMKLTGENLYPKLFTGPAKDGELERMTAGQRTAWEAAFTPENEKFLADMKAGKLDDNAVTRWKYQRYMKDYLRCIRAVDEGVGKVLDYLDESGLSKNTIVIYSADQGFYLGEHGWFDKRWMFEESLSMPFIIRWPGVTKPGTRNASLIQNIDYAPTFLDAAGVPVPPDMQGKSLVPVIKAGDKTPDGWRDSIYYFYSGEGTHHVAAHDGIRGERYKLIWFPGSKQWNLFDLEKDQQEMKSVAKDPAYAPVLADMQKRYTTLKASYGINPATMTAQRGEETKWWNQRHNEKMKEAKQNPPDLVFLGDSITQNWETNGKDVWAQYYGTRKALNLGFSGDHTEHVLWRLLNGELDHIDPKVFVLMIGTNNTGHRMDGAEDTTSGVRRILDLLHERKPNAKVVLMPIFPRGQLQTDPMRIRNNEVNQKIKAFADEKTVFNLDLTSKLIDADGKISKEMMPDFLHPRVPGYQLWAEALEPLLLKFGVAKP